MPKKYKYKYFHGTMSDETKHKLQKLSEAMEVSKSSVITEMVEHAYDSVFGKEEEQQLYVIRMPKTNLYLSKRMVVDIQHPNGYFHGKFDFSYFIMGNTELFTNKELSTIVPKCYRSFAEKAPEPKK